MKLPESILLVDKPKGITSFDVIRKLRRELGVWKMGHAGTLDPFATGLLIIGIKEGTKKMNEYSKLSKTYDALVLLGVQTDTGDVTGSVLEEKVVPEIPQKEIKKALQSMQGTLELPAPVYSAIKQGGEALYRKARRGEKVEAPIRKMVVNSAESYDISYDSVAKKHIIKVRFNVESGVYIRSLGEELGRRLGYPATLQELRRTSIGEFTIENARTLKAK